MPDQVTFQCLRCGNEWRGVLDTDVERMCLKCRSNSVRRVKETKAGTQVDKSSGKSDKLD